MCVRGAKGGLPPCCARALPHCFPPEVAEDAERHQSGTFPVFSAFLLALSCDVGGPIIRRALSHRPCFKFVNGCEALGGLLLRFGFFFLVLVFLFSV